MKYERIDSVIDRVNAWIDFEGIKVLNVETVGRTYRRIYDPSPDRYKLRVWYEE